MSNKVPLAALGVTSAQDLGVLDANPPPLDFTRDLKLPDLTQEKIGLTDRPYRTPDSIDTASYWQPGGP